VACMKILVTGASGFIGGRFARFALEQGLAVRVNGRREEALQPLVARGAEFMAGDLSDPALVRALCSDVDAVVHCAGAVGVWGSHEYFHQANVVMTEAIVEACLKQKVRRLVHLSSPSIYFDGQAHVGITEQQVPKRFANHYGSTKYQSELVALGAQEFGLEVLALRPRFVTGAGDTSIFPRMIAAHRKGRLRIIGQGLNKVDFTSIQKPQRRPVRQPDGRRRGAGPGLQHQQRPAAAAVGRGQLRIAPTGHAAGGAPYALRPGAQPGAG
jgi:Nucleoside-diphosphate-sugar epimerases